MLDCSIDWVNAEMQSSSEEINIKKRKYSDYRWTSDITNLVELAYALLEVGSVNNGEIEISSFVRFLGETFNIQINRCSDFYYKMRTRSGSRTIFLDKLKKLLEARMDRDDEKNYRK